MKQHGLTHFKVDLKESRAREGDAQDLADRKSLLREIWLKQIKTWFGIA